MNKLNNYIFPFNALICLAVLCIALFIVAFLGWKPCPMCLLQQLSVLCILILSVLGCIKKDSRNLNIFLRIAIIIIIIFGVYIAGNQTYMQYFDTTISNSNTCGIVDNHFLLTATKSITGTIESCSDISEQISGISLAVYSLIFFVTILGINCISFFIDIFTLKD